MEFFLKESSLKALSERLAIKNFESSPFSILADTLKKKQTKESYLGWAFTNNVSGRMLASTTLRIYLSLNKSPGSIFQLAGGIGNLANTKSFKQLSLLLCV